MENIGVALPRRVTSDELRQLVEELGGYWNEELPREQGVLERRKARIYVSLVNNIQHEYDAEELDAVRRDLGMEPVSVIDIHIGNSASSPSFAEQFARTVIDRWGGVVDRGS